MENDIWKMVLLLAPTGRYSLVRKGGLEPPHLSVPDPKSGASANSATFANQITYTSSARARFSSCSLVIKALENLSQHFGICVITLRAEPLRNEVIDVFLT